MTSTPASFSATSLSSASFTAVPEAPAEIRDDLEVLDDAYSKYGHALATIDPAKVDQNLQKKLTAKINERRVMRASQNIVAWARKNCA
jgi:hypothetical protein